MTPEQLAALAKLVVKHENIVNILAQNSVDVALILEQLLPRCTRCKEAPCTVYHEHLPEHRMCDHCAAEVAVKSGRNFTADLEDPTNLLRGSLMREDDWHDLPHAEKIRKLVVYVDVYNSLSNQVTVH